METYEELLTEFEETNKMIKKLEWVIKDNLATLVLYGSGVVSHSFDMTPALDKTMKGIFSEALEKTKAHRHTLLEKMVNKV